MAFFLSRVTTCQVSSHDAPAYLETRRDATPEGALSLVAAHPKVRCAGSGGPKAASATCPTRRLAWSAPPGTHKESRAGPRSCPREARCVERVDMSLLPL